MKTFDPKVTVARKQHECWGCLCVIHKGDVYINYPGENDAGEFQSTKLCHECSYLLTQKTGATAHSIAKGNFSERLIPNFLRKKRNEYRLNPKAVLKASGLLDLKTDPEPLRPCSQIVVKAIELERKIFHLPESRWKVEQFPKGGSVTIKAGVNGKARTATIKGAWSTTGEAFGCSKRQVAILVA